MMNLLFVHWNVDPVLFHIGGLQVRWYGLLFASIFVIGWYLFKWFFTREKADTRLMDPLFVSVFVATIVGARLGHCIFISLITILAPGVAFWRYSCCGKEGLRVTGAQ